MLILAGAISSTMASSLTSAALKALSLAGSAATASAVSLRGGDNDRAAATLQLESSPSQTPQVSNVPALQHKPSSPSTPEQQAPSASTLVASPSHTPHASSDPDAQQAPSAAILACPRTPEQQRPSFITGPMQHAPPLSMDPEQLAGIWQCLPEYSTLQRHIPSKHAPCPEQFSAAHGSQGVVAHAVAAMGFGAEHCPAVFVPSDATQ